MLAPLLLDIEDDLAATANVLRAIDGFAESVLSASLAQQAPPILWIPEVQGALNDIRAVAQQWLQVRPTVVQPLCNPFLNYTASVSALQNTLRSGATADDWMAALSALQKAARENSEQVRGVQENVATQHARFTEAHTKLQRALDDAQQGVEDALVDIQKVSRPDRRALRPGGQLGRHHNRARYGDRCGGGEDLGDSHLRTGHDRWRRSAGALGRGGAV